MSSLRWADWIPLPSIDFKKQPLALYSNPISWLIEISFRPSQQGSTKGMMKYSFISYDAHKGRHYYEACPESKCTEALMARGNFILICWLHCRVILFHPSTTRPVRAKYVENCRRANRFREKCESNLPPSSKYAALSVISLGRKNIRLRFIMR